jgi:hypothetical protein
MLAEDVTMLSGPGGSVVVLNGPDGKFVVDNFVAPAWPRLKAALAPHTFRTYMECYLARTSF